MLVNDHVGIKDSIKGTILYQRSYFIETRFVSGPSNITSGDRSAKGCWRLCTGPGSMANDLLIMILIEPVGDLIEPNTNTRLELQTTI